MSESVKITYCVVKGDSDICVGTILNYMLQKSLGLGDRHTCAETSPLLHATVGCQNQ